ncbi:phospholipid/cholesterol/gamma-HCH transport system substrate-binding protein [Maridesulfovibrio ferrireducens]|uniref:Phospholipid/cholesterol/gamma-HCH transport system substrate-binding protein n=1 Tax=Maridesulfovibrio ferrireducens TaxID=246191 RepID=A0A1G9C353_9BACT|nr:MlaD family protein [Maridesulfovibrio ferrireducens]SDK45715.1 phospholipid/cholesterol/gamma-HCH transport system substrate-binding protein [Maridesulfovibrio ferrireducens]
MVLNPRSSKTDIIKASLAALGGLAVLGLFIVFLGGHDFFADYSTYNISFRNVKDLTSGRPVKYAGLSVGKVGIIEIDEQNPGRISVVINVDRDFALYEGTVATITQKGLVGDNYILLELERDPGPKLAPGAMIPVAVTLSMNDVAAEIGKAVAAVAPKLEKAAEGLQALFSGENRANLEKSLKIAPDVLAQTNATLVSFQKEWVKLSRTASTGIESGTKNLGDITVEISDTLQKVEKVLQSLEGDMKNTLQSMNGEVTRVADGVDGLTSDLRKNLEYDQEEIEIILLNVNRLSREMNRLARSLRERPWQVLNPPEGAGK